MATVTGNVNTEDEAPEEGELLVLDEKSSREIAEACEALDRGEGIPAEEVFAHLRRRRAGQ